MDEHNACEYLETALTVFVIGASGDLAKKKTYPSLFALYASGYLPEHVVIVGYARSTKKDADFRKQIAPYIKSKTTEAEAKKEDFLSKCIYRSGNYDSAEDVGKVSKEMEAFEEAHGTSVVNRLFYFAIPPTVFEPIGLSIKKAALTSCGWNRLIVEKPFGHDLESFNKLSKDMGVLYNEDEIYRIDHYLGKEMVQNLLVLRFSNTIFEPIWNRNYISSVTITFKEDIGTEGRGGYFDSYGIIRDVMQNHLLQVLSLVAMEPPVMAAGNNYSNYIRDEKVKVLNCIEPIKLENTVLGQYEGDKERNEPGYLDDPTVPKESVTPTFATAIMYVNNPRWSGVPFIMKAGKALNERKGEIRVQFRPPPAVEHMFPGVEIPVQELVLRLQPEEAVYMKMNMKSPGLQTQAISSELDLSYSERYEGTEVPDAYTRLILDVLRGKQAAFVRDDELRAAWKIFTPLLDEIEGQKVKPLPYTFGSRGPKESDELVNKAGFQYHHVQTQEMTQRRRPANRKGPRSAEHRKFMSPHLLDPRSTCDSPLLSSSLEISTTVAMAQNEDDKNTAIKTFVLKGETPQDVSGASTTASSSDDGETKRKMDYIEKEKDETTVDSDELPRRSRRKRRVVILLSPSEVSSRYKRRIVEPKVQTLLKTRPIAAIDAADRVEAAVKEKKRKQIAAKRAKKTVCKGKTTPNGLVSPVQDEKKKTPKKKRSTKARRSLEPVYCFDLQTTYVSKLINELYEEQEQDDREMYNITRETVLNETSSCMCSQQIENLNMEEFRRLMTYGEVSVESVATTILPLLDLGENDVFFDLGCGTGKILVQAVLQTPCKRATGIELMQNRVLEGHKALKRLQERDIAILRDKQIKIFRGDIFVPPEQARLMDATVVFINNVMFGPALMLKVMELLKDMSKLRCVITLRKICERHGDVKCTRAGNFCIEYVHPPIEAEIDVSWADKTSVYLYESLDYKLRELRRQLANGTTGSTGWPKVDGASKWRRA
ncbi:unnamed protein product [Peronospora farinosa]|uniref:Multifunctional fusion protein n=1 Tax=Peronospora farinosa TaxID=134698 RepID=A0AAV0TBL4_9STRA|nr:unnamed protein product [Peronospora farinosa]CAI5718902.1 unnamed protein product [Peronospora farinosa]